MLHKVLGVFKVEWRLTNQGQMMFASSSATPYVMEPLLDTVGLRGCLLCVFWEGHKTLGNSTSGIHFPVTVVTDSSLFFDVPKCLGKFVFKFGSGVLIDDTAGTSVCQ